jgi:uncharacterized surface protein with fasciclin (FAS1) repeats
MLRLFTLSLSAVAASVALAGGSSTCSSVATVAVANTTAVQAPAAAGTKTIVETAVAAGNFKTLATLLTNAGLVEALNGKGPFTVFAPTDEAFAKLPKEVVADLMKPENKAMLASILTYHVVPAKAMAKDVVGMKNATTLQGQRVDIKTKDGKVMVDGATVTATDIACSNGVIHVIDSVILPVDMDITKVAAKAGSFKTLLAALDAAGLTETFRGKGPFTVLAPTDEAFAKLPKGTIETLLKPENKAQLVAILSAHVVPSVAAYSDQVMKMKEVPTLGGSPLAVKVEGGKVMIGGATVVIADVEASNGVIHAIDTVILPGAPATKTAAVRSN